MSNDLYLVTHWGERHEDHIPSVIGDFETISSKYIFLCYDEDITSLKPNEWSFGITVVYRKDIADVDSFLNESKNDSFAEDYTDLLMFANVLKIEIGADIPYT